MEYRIPTHTWMSTYVTLGKLRIRTENSSRERFMSNSVDERIKGFHKKYRKVPPLRELCIRYVLRNQISTKNIPSELIENIVVRKSKLLIDTHINTIRCHPGKIKLFRAQLTEPYATCRY